MTKYADLFAALAAPFEDWEVKTRHGGGGSNQRYITARTAMNRLDNVIGPENWWESFEAGEHSVLCKLTLRLPDGEIVTKADAGGYAGMSDQGDDDKSGYSDAFKRACVKFGVARYLYRDGVPEFAQHCHAQEKSPPSAKRRSEGERRPAQDDEMPRDGKAMFTWVRQQEKRYGSGLLQYLNGWARQAGLPSRMVGWNADETAEAYREAVRVIEHKAKQAS